MLRLAGGVARRAETRASAGIQPVEGVRDAAFRQIGQLPHDHLHIGKPVQIAPDDARHLVIAKTPQCPLQCIHVADRREKIGETPSIRGQVAGRIQLGRAQRRQRGCVTLKVMRGELAPARQLQYLPPARLAGVGQI